MPVDVGDEWMCWNVAARRRKSKERDDGRGRLLAPTARPVARRVVVVQGQARGRLVLDGGQGLEHAIGMVPQ